MSEQALPPVVAVELARRYRAREQAEVELVAYLRGVCDALGIDPARVEGFDDTRRVILLREDDPPA